MLIIASVIKAYSMCVRWSANCTYLPNLGCFTVAAAAHCSSVLPAYTCLIARHGSNLHLTDLIPFSLCWCRLARFYHKTTPLKELAP
jgi:hypothetical protein